MEVQDDGVSTEVSMHGARTFRRRVCGACGQQHALHEPHLYDYVDEVDEDMTCHICLQPLVTPVDTPCGHTFCRPCLISFLRVQLSCPIDRKPLSQNSCSLSSLVLKKLLEKLRVKCPNTDHCELTLQRGDLDDHLKYRCPGNWVSCLYSAAGCDFRGPQKKVISHETNCKFKDEGVYRSEIIEGEPSYIEIPRTQKALGMAIVGGVDTPLRCVVIQEIFPDGLIGQDGRLQAGDQIIEIEGKPMTNATHHQVCQTLRKSSSVLRLGIYREKIDVSRTPYYAPSRGSSVAVSPPPYVQQNNLFSDTENGYRSNLHKKYINKNYTKSQFQSTEEQMLIEVNLMRESGRHLGIKLSGHRNEPGIFVMELMPGSVAEQDGRLQPNDRIIIMNGTDMRYARLDYAFKLIRQSHGHIDLTVCRDPNYFKGEYDHLFKKPHPDLVISHSRTKSAPERLDKQNWDPEALNGEDVVDCGVETNERSASCESLGDSLSQSVPGSRCQSSGSLFSAKCKNSVGSFGDEIHIQHNRLSNSGLNKSSRSVTSPVHFIQESEEGFHYAPALPPRSRQPLGRTSSFDQLDLSEVNVENPSADPEAEPTTIKTVGMALPASGCADVVDGPNPKTRRPTRESIECDITELSHGMKKSLRLEGSQLHQKTVTISKNANESLGMRIGGGVSSNEGDIPIYIANIHPQGPVGKSKQVKKGDILLSVNGNTLLGLTHTQAVCLLKATADLAGVTLSLLEGPETFTGAANFVPSWMFWQRLPRALHISKQVFLHRSPGASLGFSIVGGNDPERGPEPIHILFVVATSPAAIDGKLRCGDRILAVDGHCLEGVSHAMAVCLLKQTGQRVTLEIISWMGTEL